MARRPRRRPRRTPRALRPREPRSAEVAYIAALRRVWLVAQQIIVTGLEPLLEIWPAEEPRSDAVRPVEEAGIRLGLIPTPGRDLRPVTQYPVGNRRRPRQFVNPGPFGPPLRRRISDLTDTELRSLWPGLDPQDVRRFAPWATSHEEVYRVAFPAGTPIREGTTAVFELEPRVRAAINAERRMLRPDRPTIGIVPNRRPSWAFQVRYPVYDRAGNIMLPPRPHIVSSATISQQFGWMNLALHNVVSTANVGAAINPALLKTALFAAKESERILGIDLRRGDPTIQPLINAWRELNINLIESGTMAHAASPKRRPPLLADISRIVEDAHRRGIRVEALAGQLAARFGVSDKRAELIARDQILKLNAKVNQGLQQRIGVREYTWSTSRDERVREMHAELEGTRQSYTNPPEIAPGRFGHPGDDYQCRCVAIPIMPPRQEGPE